MCFAEDATLLYCLQLLRESTPTGKLAGLEPKELGYHPGVTCDRSGQSPIVGNRYKMRDENYDVCEAEYEQMPSEEQAEYTKIAPPVFRKSKGCGPAEWHLYYSIEVAEQRSGSGGLRHDTVAASAVGALSAISSAISSTRAGEASSPRASGTPKASTPKARPRGDSSSTAATQPSAQSA